MSERTYESLPAVVRAYFERSAGGSGVSVDAFTEDAHVADDGKSYRGREEIAEWLEGAATAFEYTTTFLGANGDQDAVTVTNRLEGTFPGGVVDLCFRFRVEGEQIAELSIAP